MVNATVVVRRSGPDITWVTVMVNAAVLVRRSGPEIARVTVMVNDRPTVLVRKCGTEITWPGAGGHGQCYSLQGTPVDVFSSSTT